MKTISTQYMAIALFAVVASIGLGYNALMDHRDQEAYASGMELLAAQDAAPTTHRSFVEDGTTWHEKCEHGFCWVATNPESLKGSMVRKGGSAGIPVTDISALQQLESQAQPSH